MSGQWQTAPDGPSAAQACAGHIVSLLETALSNREFATLAVSGGSTPRWLFARLAEARVAWERIHFFWVDERCVPPADPASNYKLAHDSLIVPAHIGYRQVHRIMGEMDPAGAAARYTAEIRGFFGLEPGEMPQFDVVHRGIGPDAHTASLFPGDPLIDDHEGIAAATFSRKFNQWRVTLLAGPLAAAHETVFLVAGGDKAEAVRAVFHEEYDPKTYPAQIGTRHGHGVTWFLDDQAAALLE
jgi:6-phosphogluconolactonase